MTVKELLNVKGISLDSEIVVIDEDGDHYSPLLSNVEVDEDGVVLITLS